MPDQIDMLHIVEACLGIRAIFWVRIIFALSGIECNKVDDRIDDANSLTLVGEETKYRGAQNHVLLAVRDPH